MVKQHIVGMLIFVFIVGTAIVAGTLSIQIPDKKSVIVSDYSQITYRAEKRCRRKKRPKKPRKPRPRGEEKKIEIERAVYHRSSEKLKFNFSSFDADDAVRFSPDVPAKVALHFFVSDRYGTRHLATEYTTVTSAVKFVQTYSWLKNLQSPENLYVMPRYVGEEYDFETYLPVFDRARSTPVGIEE